MQYNVALIILAAGNSSRLGQPKQLKTHAGKSLLEHTIEAALGSECDAVFVVLGSNHDTLRSLICSYPVMIIHNEMWESGMGSSISAGVKGALHSRKNWDALIISTCDQPYLSCDIFNLLIANHRNAAKIVASAYDGTFGVPVLFSGEFVNELKQLGGNDGAKKVIKNHQDKLVTVPFVHGECDIDTEADWQSFLEQNSGTI